ncbi:MULTISPECIES: AAA family ATPase [unclassified Thioalkalivibrio]|uniref:AAA family ATPase n=1 Tax=unclassified Thioalkalivibrio TaxID=2621013 RepID=UPI00037BF382|nr:MULTISPECIES: AAA family ATPase [unclassified Thioalkalivibrio]
MRLTDEQQAIRDTRSKKVSVSAFAGTGKSSTLRALAESRPRETFLYIAYNSSVAREANDKFPANTKCTTAHGLAYAGYGHLYRSKGKLQAGGSMTAWQVLQALPEAAQSHISEEQRPVFARHVLESLNRFLYSSDKQIKMQHVAFRKANDPDANYDAHEILKAARFCWRLMVDYSTRALPMTHDGYLKVFQISDPILKGDTILLDEGQDANGSMLSIIDSQRSVRKIFVGDRHQQIYAYRGALNALDRLEGFDEYALTQSFRYGETTASLATRILKDASNEERVIRGAPIETEIAVAEANLEPGKAILGRSNIGLINRALEAIDQRIPVSFRGGLKQYDPIKLVDVYALKYGGTLRSPELKRFRSYETLSYYAQKSGDADILSAIKLVDTRGRDLLRDMDRLTHAASCPRDPSNGIDFLTVHKAKGLEFDRVELSDDFSALEGRRKSETRAVSEVPLSEINLLYVALTRGIRRIDLPKGVRSFIQANWPTAGVGLTREEWLKTMPASAGKIPGGE